MLLSVVIPFYHVEKYIGECLALAGQIEDCEILLVDDCGSDGSAQIAADFCRMNPHARVIRREQNGGLSAARNTGLAQAKGEYVYFLDSDDLPVPDALTALVCQARQQQLDVAKARFVFFDDETLAQTPGPAIAQTDVMSGGALFAGQCRAGLYEPMVWQCVYRLDFLRMHNLTMAEGLLFEDELFQAPCLLKAQRAAAFEMEILRYRQRVGSIMGSFAKSSRWCKSYLEVCRRLSALAKTLEAGDARRALEKRVGQIALSVAKNIPAYHLPQQVAAEVKAFLRENLRELTGYALSSGDAAVAAQGMLLRVSPEGFIKLYQRQVKAG
ncbi:MAG: glycosyltransferase [Clostridia bacterium]|nr:glycosyltransferase [Clostridia bacterium]